MENEQTDILESLFEQVFSRWLESQPRATDVVALKAIAFPFFKLGYKRGAKESIRPLVEKINQAACDIDNIY